MNEAASTKAPAGTDLGEGNSAEGEALPEELIFEDTDSWVEDTPVTQNTIVRTVAFLADGRTSSFLLRETVASLVARQKIESAIVDISTEAGIVTAHQLLESGIDYTIFDTVPPKVDEENRPLVEVIRSRSQGTTSFDPGNIAAIDANVVLMPAPAEDSGPGIDVSDGTITAVVLEQLQAAGLSCLMLLPPEAGLRRQDDGSYVRLTLQLAE
ncbi:hypothetical protein [Arthrobacter sp. AD-310]